AAGAAPVRVLADTQPPENVCVGRDGTRFTLRTPGGVRHLHTPLVGRHQAMNTAVALAMLEAAGAPYAAAARDAETMLSHVSIPGRFQQFGDIIVDVAHNPAGTAALCHTIELLHLPRPLTVLLTVLRDKDWRGMMELLSQHADRIVLTAPPSVPADRAWVLDEAAAFAHERGWNVVVERDFDRALELVREGAATTLITGSFHTVGDAMARLPLCSPAA
ncbi:MAG TPA: cyanophycin synthetase, partial [Gemmatimonadaceae bacterium]|nr:cyanophycin synthetase [Gemmatimonadaceae bacterium]